MANKDNVDNIFIKNFNKLSLDNLSDINAILNEYVFDYFDSLDIIEFQFYMEDDLKVTLDDYLFQDYKKIKFKDLYNRILNVLNKK